MKRILLLFLFVTLTSCTETVDNEVVESVTLYEKYEEQELDGTIYIMFDYKLYANYNSNQDLINYSVYFNSDEDDDFSLVFECVNEDENFVYSSDVPSSSVIEIDISNCGNFIDSYVLWLYGDARQLQYQIDTRKSYSENKEIESNLN